MDSVRTFEVCPLMSTPRSAITRMASGWTEVFSVPALWASKRSTANERRNPSAIWLPAELCVQRKCTRGVSRSHLACSFERANDPLDSTRRLTGGGVSATETQQFTRMQRLTAEGVGTAMLLAAVVGSGIMGERLAGGNVAVALLANTVATGAALVALI